MGTLECFCNACKKFIESHEAKNQGHISITVHNDQVGRENEEDALRMKYEIISLKRAIAENREYINQLTQNDAPRDRKILKRLFTYANVDMNRFDLVIDETGIGKSVNFIPNGMKINHNI